MPSPAARVLELARSETGRRALRYSAVSCFTVPTSQVLLLIMIKGFQWDWVWSNVITVSLVTIPAYFMNRYWVWRKTGRNHIRREVLPFWAAAFAGLFLSTWAVHWVESQTTWPLAVNLANLASFGLVWVGRYLLLDKLVFAHHPLPEAPAPQPVGTEVG